MIQKWSARVVGYWGFNASKKPKDDISTIAEGMGYKELNIFKHNFDGEDDRALISRIEGITAAVNPGDIIVYQFPIYNGSKFDFYFFSDLKQRGAQIAVFIIDIDQMRYREVGYDEISLLNLVDILIVHGTAMKEWLLSKGIKAKIIIKEFFDCLLLEQDVSLSHDLTRQLVFAGAAGKSTFLGNWHYQTKLMAFHDEANFVVSDSIESRGSYPFNELVRQMPRDRFGVYWESDTDSGTFEEYSRYTAPHKVALYLSLGMPIIAWEGSAAAEVIKKYGLGFSLSSLDEIDALMSSLSDEDLSSLKERVNRFSESLRSGLFTRQALIDVEEFVLTGY